MSYATEFSYYSTNSPIAQIIWPGILSIILIIRTQLLDKESLKKAGSQVFLSDTFMNKILKYYIYI